VGSSEAGSLMCAQRAQALGFGWSDYLRAVGENIQPEGEVVRQYIRPWHATLDGTRLMLGCTVHHRQSIVKCTAKPLWRRGPVRQKIRTALFYFFVQNRAMKRGSSIVCRLGPSTWAPGALSPRTFRSTACSRRLSGSIDPAQTALVSANAI